jgi:photosystem II stability/assembly factor-like uncharacterized protein
MAACLTDAVYFTDDQWDTYSDITPPAATPYFVSIAIGSDNQTIWVLDSANGVWLSENQGADWELLAGGYSGDSTSIALAADNLLILSSIYGNTVRESPDLSVHWNEEQPGGLTSGNWTSVAIGGGVTPLLLVCDDGGRIWLGEYAPISPGPEPEVEPPPIVILSVEADSCEVEIDSVEIGELPIETDEIDVNE